MILVSHTKHILISCSQIELTSPAASEQSRADCEAICKLGLKAKVGITDFRICIFILTSIDSYSHQMPYG